MKYSVEFLDEEIFSSSSKEEVKKWLEQVKNKYDINDFYFFKIEDITEEFIKD